MKTLVVSCCPRGERSRTRKLVEAFMDPPPPGELEVLDLCRDVPDFLTPDRVSAYEKRNYRGEELTAGEKALLEKMDRMTAQLLSCDVLVLAWPMYNFSMPALMKAWFDSVMQRGRTWDIGGNGFFGLMRGRKALAITASGSIYEGPMESWDHSFPLAEIDLRFMGFDDVRNITAAGLNLGDQIEESSMIAAKQAIRELVTEWYR